MSQLLQGEPDWRTIRPRLGEGVVVKNMGEVAVVFARDQPPYLANETCKLILNLLDGTNTISSITYRLTRGYDVTEEQASADVVAAIRGLAKIGAVTYD